MVEIGPDTAFFLSIFLVWEVVLGTCGGGYSMAWVLEITSRKPRPKIPLAFDELPRTSEMHLSSQGFELVRARTLLGGAGAGSPDTPLLASAGLLGPVPACCLRMLVSACNAVLMRANKCAHHTQLKCERGDRAARPCSAALT